MKKIALALTALAFLQAQELEVEGNLKVTGTVESATIDSLNQVIATMQAEIVELQAGGGWETRAFTLNYNSSLGDTWLSIEALTGYNLDIAEIRIADVTNTIWDVNENWSIDIEFFVPSGYVLFTRGATVNVRIDADYGSPHTSFGTGNIYISSEYPSIYIEGESSYEISFTVTFLVTAQFPD